MDMFPHVPQKPQGLNKQAVNSLFTMIQHYYSILCPLNQTPKGNHICEASVSVDPKGPLPLANDLNPSSVLEAQG